MNFFNNFILKLASVYIIMLQHTGIYIIYNLYRITCDLGQLLEKKCDHIPMNPEWQVDPLKFKVDGPLHVGITYIAVVTNLHADKPDGKFVLCDVYWRYDTKLGRPSRGVCFDIVLPEK